MSGIIGVSPDMKSGVIGKWPAGHVVKSGLLEVSFSGSHIVTTSSTFSDTGVAGTIVTLLPSTQSRLELETYIGLKYVDALTYGQETICVTTSSNTTYAEGNDLIDSAVSNRNRDSITGLHHPHFSRYHLKPGGTGDTINPGNLTSWSAGDTLYWRCFMQSVGGVTNFLWYHNNAHYTISYREVAL